MSVLPEASRVAFEAWLKGIPTAEKYSFDSEGRGYQKDRSVMMRMAWQASRKQALEEAEELLWIHHTTLAQSLAIKELLK